MQKLEYRRKPTVIPRDSESDILIIISAFARAGYEVGPLDAFRAWSEYSESLACSWVAPSDDEDEIVRTAIPYLTEA